MCVKIELLRTLQFKLRIEVLSSTDFAGRIHPEGAAGDVVCQPRGPSSDKEEQLDEMNGEQGAPERRT